MMKKLLHIFLAGLMLMQSFCFLAAAQEKITVMVNEEELQSDVPAQSWPVYDADGNYVGDRVMMPIGAISEKLNCDVYWNEEDEGILLYRKNNLYMMWVGKEVAFHQLGFALEKGYVMDILPTVINDRTFIPVRAVAELLGAEVQWIEETNTVDIRCELGELEQNVGIAKECAIYGTLLFQYYEDYKGFLNGNLEAINGSILLESGEEMKFEVYPQLAPETCQKFISLANDHFYDGTVFHRVIEGFVAQGGGYDQNGDLKSTPPIPGEFIMNGIFNLISHKRGVLSLARANDPNSGTNQFFIMHKDNPGLDGNYAAFGRIVEGLDVLDNICSTETDAEDKPVIPIVIKQIRIEQQ